MGLVFTWKVKVLDVVGSKKNVYAPKPITEKMGLIEEPSFNDLINKIRIFYMESHLIQAWGSLIYSAEGVHSDLYNFNFIFCWL